MAEKDRLRAVVQQRHHLKCTHVRSERVLSSKDGTAWEGIVEVYACTNDDSLLAYAWTHGTAAGRHDVAILGSAMVRSARDAVRAHLAADEAQQGRG